MIASAQTLMRFLPVNPFYMNKVISHGMSYGLSAAGYDIRAAEDCTLEPGAFALGSSYERFTMPTHFLGIVHDKSTWARKGLCVQNTVIEPGWNGYLTLEYTNHSQEVIKIVSGMPIAQIVFHILDETTCMPYIGKYQDQKPGPQEAIMQQAFDAEQT